MTHDHLNEKGLSVSKSPFSDLAGMGISILCLVHCLFMPVLFLVIPWLHIVESILHPVLGILAFGATWFSLKRSKGASFLVYSLFVFGNLWITGAGMLLHDSTFSTMETILINCGSLMLIAGHFLQYKKQKT